MKRLTLRILIILIALINAVKVFASTTDDHVNISDVLRLDYQIQNIAKNRPGTTATDFQYIDLEGKRSTLHAAISPGAEYVLLGFFDPDCDTCHQMIDHLKAMPEINEAIARGTLRVIFITPIEVDIDQWRDYASTLPDSWVAGYSPNGELDFDELYFLPTIPTLYLLDGKKTILIRNLTLPQTLDQP